MSRTVTAADIMKLGYAERLPLYMQLRQASMNPTISLQQRRVYRLAARFVRGNLNTPLYDTLARLQILEGVAGIVSLKPMTAGPWSKDPRRGLRSARDFFADSDIDPEWLSPGNTGLISKILGMIRQEWSKWTRKRDVHFDPEDILQNGLMGLTKDGTGQLTHGPLLIQFGHANKGVQAAIREGRVSPSDVAGIAAKNFVQKVSDQFNEMDKQRAPSEDAAGRSILDLQEGSLRDPSDIMADALSDPNSPIRKLVYKRLEEEMGESKWTPMAMDFMVAIANGEKINKGEMAAQYGMAGGTFSKVLREKVYPAIETLQHDSRLQGQLSDYAERMQRR